MIKYIDLDMIQFKHKSMIEGKFGFKCLLMLLESWILR